MKGIVLAGGSGSRLFPVTKGVSKQLLPIYNKPTVYYPLSTLMLAGIREILIITTPADQEQFKKLLGDGSQFGINLSYAIQEKPNGIAEAFIIGEDFIGNEDVALILGDNIFYGAGFSEILQDAVRYTYNHDVANIFTYRVCDEEAKRFGIVEFDDEGKVISIEEKPQQPKSNNASVGLYFYPVGVSKKAKTLTPSKRGELEITALNQMYQKIGLRAVQLPRGFAWLDSGTFDSLAEASSFVETIEKRQGLKIACLEEIAYNNKWISKEKLIEIGKSMQNNEYGQYLLKIAQK